MFKNEVIENLVSYLPSEYRNSTVRTFATEKVNVTYETIVVDLKGRNNSPSLYLDEFYKRYLDTMDEEAVIKEMAEIVVEVTKTMPPVIKVNLDDMKDHIVPQIINTKKNEKLLSQVPHKEFLDLSIIYRVLIPNQNCSSEEDDVQASAIITNSLLEDSSIEANDLFEIALKNSERDFPATFMKLHLLCPMIVVSKGLENSWGASTILYHDVFRKLAEELDDDLVMIPSSTHEWIVQPKRICDPDMMQSIFYSIEDVNKTVLPDTDFLSDHPYLYCKETGVVSCIENK